MLKTPNFTGITRLLVESWRLDTFLVTIVSRANTSDSPPSSVIINVVETFILLRRSAGHFVSKIVYFSFDTMI